MATALTSASTATMDTAATVPEKVLEVASIPTTATTLTTSTSPMTVPTTPPTPSAAFTANVRPLITTATQTALRRQDIPTMYHFEFDDNSKENTIALSEEEPIGASKFLTPCPICSRTFNSVSLSKHVVICQKMATKKRKPFDSSRQRREGTELASFLPINFGLPPSKQTSSEATGAEDKFVRSTARSSMRGSSSTSNSIGSASTGLTTLMPTSPKPNTLSGSRHDRFSSTERPRRSQAIQPVSQRCPHCERQFGVKAFDRHVEWCKEKALQGAIKNSSSQKDKAKELLEARTKYRAPIRTRRSINREKYSGLTCHDNEGDEFPKVMTSSAVSERNEGDDFSIYSQESQKSSQSQNENKKDTLEPKPTRSSAEKETIDYDCSKSSQADDEKHRASTSPGRRSPTMDQSHRQDLFYERIENFGDYPQEGIFKSTMRSNLNSSSRVPRQCTEPNLRLHSMQCNNNQYFVDDMNPMIGVNPPIYIPHQQQWQMPLTSLNCFPSAFVNFDGNPLEFKHQIKKKTLRKSPHTGHGVNPNTPMKAFSMPFGDSNMISMPNMYARMILPLNIQAKVTNNGNKTPTEYDEHGSGYERNYTEAQKSVPKRPKLLSGLSDSTYDPFLSAKRQLEDLCASASPPDNDSHFLGNSKKTLSTPTTPSAILPTKMTTSLTLSTSIPSTTSSLNSSNTTQPRKQLTASSTTSGSNFRRTSSLRGPRRSPLLNTRPLFAQKRPTIQRGLSDEGPISTNFLKSEEYDEIPVRSVCVNDFAITNSPRVVRRDTSLSNRKASLKLNIPDSDHNFSVIAGKKGNERFTANSPKDLSKTDSLAAFLKYERELEKLNQHESKSLGKESSNLLQKVERPDDKPQTLSDGHEPTFSSTLKVASPVFTKELKDKSNTLSKQNSAKSLKIEPEQFEGTKPVQESLNYGPHNAASTPTQTSTGMETFLGNACHPEQTDTHTRQTRLEPLQHSGQDAKQPNSALAKRNTVSNISTKQPSQLPMLSQQISTTTNVAVQQEQQQQQQQSFFSNADSGSGGGGVKQQVVTSSYDKENKALSSSTEFIDPKLINKCDNLPVKLADLKYADSDSSAEQHKQGRCDRATDPYEKCVQPISQLSKMLPLVNKTNANSTTTVQMRNAHTQSTPKHAKNNVQPSLHSPQHQTQKSMLPRPGIENKGANGTSGRNLLKRKMRLGRNQFLYDTSPEALEIDSSCSADDETNPRSSTESNAQFNNPFEQFIHKQTSQFRFKTPSPPDLATLPTFDDFDFKEFLSSFENDEEEFPLIRNCREFLRNRPTKNIPTSTPNRQSSNKLNSTPKSPFDSINYQSQNFFQFPVLSSFQANPTKRTEVHLLPSSRRSNTKTLMNHKGSQNDNPKSEDFHSARSGDSVSYQEENTLPAQHTSRRDSGGDFKKREIFISIETEQSDDLCRTAISPNSLRDMVGNSQAVVEVEVDANDNKFSKISDDDENDPNGNENGNVEEHRPIARLVKQLPNVEKNNARNLIQRKVEDNETTVYAEEKNSTTDTNDQIDGVRTGNADSDDLSSLEGYPLASNSSSRRSAGVASKLSADSAYGSLSRQRSSELSGRAPPRSSSRNRPATAATSNMAQFQQQYLLQQQYQQQLMLQQQQQKQQQQLKYAHVMLKGARTRQMSGSSSSGSDNSLPPIVVASPSHFQQQQQFLIQQQQQISQLYQQKARSRQSPVTISSPYAIDVVNGNHPSVMIASPNPTKTSLPMSRFCHECGSKFLVEHAKFCVDCGVKRLMI